MRTRAGRVPASPNCSRASQHMPARECEDKAASGFSPRGMWLARFVLAAHHTKPSPPAARIMRCER